MGLLLSPVLEDRRPCANIRRISPLVLDIPSSATMANFGDLKSDGGLNKLNGFLSSKSYIEGFVYSAADDKVFGQLAKCPDSKKHPHAARWFRHIQSWKDGGTALQWPKKLLMTTMMSICLDPTMR